MGLKVASLQTKFILAVACVLIVTMAADGLALWRAKSVEFQAEVEAETQKTMAFLDSARSYTKEVLRPAIDAHAPGAFIPEGQTPAVVVRGIFERFAKKYPAYQFKEASDNPLNLANQADAMELKILSALRADPTKQRLTMFSTEMGNEWYVTAKPIVADAGCLRCHGDPASAPAGIREKFGTTHGFHWKTGEVVAAMTVRVPTAEIRAGQFQELRRMATYTGIMTLVVLAAVYACARWLVCIPVRRMGEEMARVAEKQSYDTPLLAGGRDDELGLSARSFNGVLAVVQRTLADLNDSKENLEKRVVERTAELHALLGELQLSQDRYNRIAANTPGMVYQFVMHADGTFSFPYVSDGCYQLYGIEAAEVRKNASLLMDAIHPEDRVAFSETVVESARTLEPWKWEGRFYHQSGELRWLQAASRPERLENGDVVWDGLGMDVTFRKQAEAELKKAKEEADSANQAKSQFVANMSHEIRTPLNGVIGMTDLLLASPLEAGQRKHAKLLKASAEALLSLINDILDFSKIEAGKLELSPVDFSLQNTVNEALEMLAPKAAAKELTLVCSVDPEIPAVVRADSDRLRQVLINLVNNAIKFTDKGQVSVQVTLKEAAAEHFMVKVAVRDTGIGIPADRLERLFKSFSQVDISTTRKYGGTGLGLAISKQLAELMGGRVGVESTEGAGSTFWFTVRLEKPLGVLETCEAGGAALQALPAGETEAKPTGGSGMPVILLAEDNEINQILAVELLAGVGYGCEVVADGVLAVEAFGSKKYDLILMDCQMPRMDGFEAARQIREEEGRRGVPRERQTIILALTANAMKGDRERCLGAGMDGYLTKPLNAVEFTHTVQTFLERSRNRSAGVGANKKGSEEQVTAAAQEEKPAAAAAIDVAKLLGQFHGNSKLVAKVFSVFQQQATNALHQINDSLAAADVSRLAKIAHLIKGSAANLSADGLRHAAEEVETAGRTESLDHLQEQVDALKAEIDRCLEQIAERGVMAENERGSR